MTNFVQFLPKNSAHVLHQSVSGADARVHTTASRARHLFRQLTNNDLHSLIVHLSPYELFNCCDFAEPCTHSSRPQ